MLDRQVKTACCSGKRDFLSTGKDDKTMYTNDTQIQTAVLVGIDTGAYDAEASLRELKELANTAGAKVAGSFLQNLPAANNATFVGGGKLLEIKEFCQQAEADLLIFDDELTGTQIRNIESATGIRTIDRTMLILDIFAMRAVSKEGKLQVELAQQKYLLPRLIGTGSILSRQGGGIGTRGPGETKLESDRRHIRRRIDALSRELKELEKRREQVRSRRMKNSVTTIAIVGYTNAGKSTLLNLLTNAGVLAKNQLFATLDPTARELKLPDGQNAVIVDTVGFIQRLPHQLIEAFRSTLEETIYADLILNICDISDPQAEQQIQVTEDLLTELGCKAPVLTVFNKTDLYRFQSMLTITPKSVFISAKENKGIDDLLRAICDCLSDLICRVDLLVPYQDTGVLDKIRRQGKILREEYTPEGISVTANIDRKWSKLVKPYLAERN